MKISFNCDYDTGAHPNILKKLASIDYEANVPYGLDKYSEQAARLILKECGQPKHSQVYFLVGGTQTNLTFLTQALRPYESVIACASGHINMHETGAIEATGHKVCSVPAVHAKLTPQAIEDCVRFHCDEHMVKPKVAYISDATELGTVYTLAELKALRQVCDKHQLYLFLDGARLGAALTAKSSDVTLADLAKLTDAFYIGGTKNGALIGEALVINNPALQTEMRFTIKQRGAMLAKGFVLGVQFEELFSNDLFFEIGRHENAMAQKIRQAFKAQGIKFLEANDTNQIFPILTPKQKQALETNFIFSIWEEQSKTAIVTRFVTGWSTTEAEVQTLVKAIQQL